jgi:acetyl-CoA acyltransferase 2
MARKAVVLGGKRTPMTEWVGGKRGDGGRGGALKDVSALDLGAVAARAALETTGVPSEKIDHVVMGNALQTSRDAIYGARHVALRAGLDERVPALTVNRLCGSGIQSSVNAAQEILLGESSYVLAGGMESMSQAPHVIWGAREGLKLGQGKLEDLLFVSLRDTTCDLLMAQTAEVLARERGISREDQDELALRSVMEANRAEEEGFFAEEIVAVPVGKGKRAREVTQDDHRFRGATAEGLAALPPAFGPEGFVTAGNASGIVDGAAALVIADEETARSDGHEPVAEIVAWASVGVDPRTMGIGPVPAIRMVLEKAGLNIDDIDRYEINEAFAAQYLAVERELELDRAKVNVNGGAIALGHPLGATGARLMLTLCREMKRRRLEWGIASACIGGGQGIAILLKNSDS